MADFSGNWFSTFGPMGLVQQGNRVEGSYKFGSTECFLRGQVTGARLDFRYEEPTVGGEGFFELLRSCKFAGRWRPDGDERWANWTGERGFEGIWESSFGLLRAVQEDGRVIGFYEGLGPANLEGELVDNRLTFRYQEPRASGEGWWQLTEEGRSFSGLWRLAGEEHWKPWVGRRRSAQVGLTWLVVIEAHWQSQLDDQEYSFGNMLKEFFARVPSVRFRHRFFGNAAGLHHWCRDLMYLSEPVVVVIATHASTEGLTVRGELVSPEVILDGVRHADNLKLLHFSSCLLLQEGPARRIVEDLLALGRFPVSGYATFVDWAASAIIEFTYLDLILAKGLQPRAAAEQILSQIRFAGETSAPDSAYPSAGFRLLTPRGN